MRHGFSNADILNEGGLEKPVPDYKVGGGQTLESFKVRCIFFLFLLKFGYDYIHNN